MSSAIVVPLRSKRQRRAQAVQKLNHAIPAFGLLVAGQQAVAGGHAGFGFYLGIFELISAGALIVLTARELRAALRSPEHSTHHVHGVDWVDIAAGFVLVAEALEHWHLTHHVSRPTILSAAITFAFGLSHGRLAAARARKRVLRVDADGISIAGRPFKARKLEAAWRDVQAIDVGDRYAVVSTRGGRPRRIDLSDVEAESHVRGALQHGQQLLMSHKRSGVQETSRQSS
jgi:hypothetical protein